MGIETMKMQPREEENSEEGVESKMSSPMAVDIFLRHQKDVWW